MSAYSEALVRYHTVGASRAQDSDVMAAFCQGDIQILCGAVSPSLVFEGAMKKGMTLKELAHLAATDPRAVADLMWLD